MIAGERQENLPMGVTISRIMSGDSKYIEIKIQDETSAMRFVTVRMTLEKFAECLTGLAASPGIGDVAGLEHVGKTMELDKISFEIPETHCARDKEMAVVCCKEYLEEINKEYSPKWVPDLAFNSQNSFYTSEGKRFARTTIRRWV